MELSFTNSGSSSDVTQTTSLAAKMKRLQIEENLLIQSINKYVPEVSQTDGSVDATSYFSFSELKAFLVKTKNSYREIKLLFQDIKSSTSSKEVLKTLDLDDVKKGTFELESRIKAFKLYLQTELSGLKSAEKELQQTINENPLLIKKLKREQRIQTAKYNEIVPSPVKTMMTSPLKCLEVQQFQEFMTKSVNRYGGWNEYHHNIFVKHWQKHFGSQTNISFHGMDDPVEISPVFNLFLYELLPKLQGIRETEIISHIKWYSKYIYLKEQQQKAIDKWRSNRKLMKSVKAELELKKDSSSITNKNNGRKSVNDYNIDNSRTISEQLDVIKGFVPQPPTQDKVRFIRKCYGENVRRGTRGTIMSDDFYSHLSNAENLIAKNLEESGEHRLLHYQKPTKQWFIKMNDIDSNIETNKNNLENIQKLRVPAWRVGL